MKKRILGILLALGFVSRVAYAYPFSPPTGDALKEPVVIRTTCYTADEGSVCSTGIEPRIGVIAACKEWENMVAFLYTYEYVDGEPVPCEMIGMYEVKDTGAGIDTNHDGRGDSIRSGKSIDVYCNTIEEAREFVNSYGDYTLLILVPDGKG